MLCSPLFVPPQRPSRSEAEKRKPAEVVAKLAKMAGISEARMRLLVLRLPPAPARCLQIWWTQPPCRRPARALERPPPNPAQVLPRQPLALGPGPSRLRDHIPRRSRVDLPTPVTFNVLMTPGPLYLLDEGSLGHRWS